jgi:hypothetical protein
VAQVLEKKTDMEHTSTFLSELAVSQLWVLEILTMKLSVDRLQVLHLLHQQRLQLHLLAELDLILAENFSGVPQQVQTLLTYKTS